MVLSESDEEDELLLELEEDEDDEDDEVEWERRWRACLDDSSPVRPRSSVSSVGFLMSS